MPIGFKDYITVDHRPGEDDLIKHRAHNRRVDEEPDEAMDLSQRRASARRFARIKTKIKIGRDRAARRIASPERLKLRARKQARNQVLKKLMKDTPKSDLSYARRGELEKRMEKPVMKTKVDRLAKKMLPIVRRAELAKKRGGGKTDK